MSHAIAFNPYTMTGMNDHDTDCLIVFMAELEEELVVFPDGKVTTLSGEYVAHAKIVGVGNGICC